jgi:hypothetical protein
MNGELNFEAMSFEGYDRLPALASEQTGFEFEEEYGRRGARQRPQGFGSHAQRIRSAQRPPSPVSGPGKPKAPRIPPYPGRWPRRAIDAAYVVAPEPYPVESAPTRSEYIRWAQSALNDVLGLQLPVHGIADAATRGAIRSFQQREGLPTDGIVGPDTERSLLAARSGKQVGSAEPATPAEPAATPTELSFESENFAFEFDNARRPAVGG